MANSKRYNDHHSELDISERDDNRYLRVGTCHFVSENHAAIYYTRQGNLWANTARHYVAEKIEAGEIKIGKPELGKDQRLITIDGGTRYAIEHYTIQN